MGAAGLTMNGPVFFSVNKANIPILSVTTVFRFYFTQVKGEKFLPQVSGGNSVPRPLAKLI